MKLFSKRALRFHHPADRNTFVDVKPGDFPTVPDWVRDSAMFKLAVKDNTVSEIETKSAQREAENDDDPALKDLSQTAKDAEGSDSVTEPPKDTDEATLKDLRALAKEAGISGFSRMSAEGLKAALEAKAAEEGK